MNVRSIRHVSKLADEAELERKDEVGKTATELVEKAKLERMRRMNNPDNLPTGPFTGRCGNCYSSDLWDDATMYGCNCCGAIFSNENPVPRMIENGTGRDLGPAY